MLAQGSPIIHSSCEGELGIALESMQDKKASFRLVSRTEFSSTGATRISGSHSRLTQVVTCIQVSQEAGKVVWYSNLLKNFPQFDMIHTVKGFGIVNEAEAYFSGAHCFFDDPMDVGNLISGSSAFSKYSLNI